jgi:TusA-related sulfurtransferase
MAESDTNPTAPGAAEPSSVFLDITHLMCPMTFVRTKLAIEKMSAGQVLEVRLNEGEPLINVPRSVKEMGHEVVSLEREPGDASIYRLIVNIT